MRRHCRCVRCLGPRPHLVCRTRHLAPAARACAEPERHGGQPHGAPVARDGHPQGVRCQTAHAAGTSHYGESRADAHRRRHRTVHRVDGALRLARLGVLRFSDNSSLYGSVPIVRGEMLFGPAIFLTALLVCCVLNVLAATLPAWLSLRKPIVESMMIKK